MKFRRVRVKEACLTRGQFGSSERNVGVCELITGVHTHTSDVSILLCCRYLTNQIWFSSLILIGICFTNARFR